MRGVPRERPLIKMGFGFSQFMIRANSQGVFGGDVAGFLFQAFEGANTKILLCTKLCAQRSPWRPQRQRVIGRPRSNRTTRRLLTNANKDLESSTFNAILKVQSRSWTTPSDDYSSPTNKNTSIPEHSPHSYCTSCAKHHNAKMQQRHSSEHVEIHNFHNLNFVFI